MKSDAPYRQIGILILMIISAALDLVLFVQAQQYYVQSEEIRLDPLGLGYFAPSTLSEDNATLNSESVVFFGDSRAADWPAPPNSSYYRFINRGISGQTSAQVLGRFEDHVKTLHPQLIIVQVGINDLKIIPLFPDRRRAIIADCKENIRQIANRSVAIGATVILTTIFPVGPIPLERRLFWSDDVDESVKEVNAYILSLGAPRVIVLDTYSILAENGDTRGRFARDTLHLNAAGYEALNNELAKILLTLK